MAKMIKTFPPNTQGRDFICADIHGCFELLERELDSAKFDPVVDRLFSLGDLINRGIDSFSALKWLRYPWFHAVIGNHEHMFMDAINARDTHPEWFEGWHYTRDEWKRSCSVDDLLELHNAFSELPIVMELQLNAKYKIGLCHAQFPKDCDWNFLKMQMENDNREYLAGILEDLIWEAEQSYKALQGIEFVQPIKNIDHVFHGHHIVDEIQTVGNRTFMDLGSYKEGKVGFLEPLKFLYDLNRRA